MEDSRVHRMVCPNNVKKGIGLESGVTIYHGTNSEKLRFQIEVVVGQFRKPRRVFATSVTL